MILYLPDLKELLAVAQTAARSGGKIIEENSNDLHVIHKKKMGSSLASSVVTEIDLLCQTRILEELQESIDKYDLGLLAEESSDNNSRFIKDYFWCVDPLDGTLPFTEGRTGYSVSVALVSREGQAEIGVIYDPTTKTIFSAIKGDGAYKNGNLLKIDNKGTNQFSVYIHRSFLKHPKYTRYLSIIEEIANFTGCRELKVTSHAGAAMNACWMLENINSLYFAVPKKENGGGNLWDFAASSLIVSEAGGIAGDFFGGPIELNRKDSTYLNHCGIFMTPSMKIKELFIEKTRTL